MSCPTPLRRSHPAAPETTGPRKLIVERNVPNNALYIAWNMCDRYDPDYYVYDTISDLLSNGHSSRLYRRLVQEEALFAELNAYITGELGPGLFLVSGKLCEGVAFEQAEAAVHDELQRLAADPITEHELEKVANKFENTFVYSQYKAADRAQSLCYYEMIGLPELINDEPQHYRSVTAADVRRAASLLTPQRSRTLCIDASLADDSGTTDSD